ncbi:MAG: PEP-CTERM sorting domain-containing protein [Acidobacteriota bacterium]
MKWLPAILVLGALPVGATTTYYSTGSVNDEAAFNTAVGSLTYQNSFLLSGSPIIATESNTGTIFAGFTNNNSVARDLGILSGMVTQTGGNGGTDSSIYVDVPTGATIIGLHLITTTNGPYCVEAPGSVACTLSVSLTNTTSFIGIISTSAISDFQIRREVGTAGQILRIANVGVSSGGLPGEAPEPSTMILMGGALLALPVLARRRRKQSRL